jgi:phosphoglycerate dehydrogenase-like enzyme
VTRLVLLRPLSDDFELTPAAREVLDLVEIEVVRDVASSADALATADVLVAGISTEALDPLELAREMPNLRWIHTMTAGIGTLATGELVEREIVVTNASGAYATAIAEYVFAALVMLRRGLPELLVTRAQHQWSEHGLGRELAGTQVGIIGFGGIGRRVAMLCAHAGMQVRAIRRRPAAGDQRAAVHVGPPGELDELLATSDAIVLSASSNRSTRHLIGARELALMPRHAVLVNVSRGELVDEAALAAALRDGAIAGAMIDVTAEEPLPAASPLWSLPNLWITPHMSGASVESRARSLDLLVENLRRYLSDGPGDLVNRVDVALDLRPG